jgi:hypothetical protein
MEVDQMKTKAIETSGPDVWQTLHDSKNYVDAPSFEQGQKKLADLGLFSAGDLIFLTNKDMETIVPLLKVIASRKLLDLIRKTTK